MPSVDIRNESQALSSLVDYQKGSVVSRSLLRKSGGKLTLFAFDIDQSLSEHTSPYDAFVYVIEGELSVVVDGKPHSLALGDVLIMEADKPHSLHAKMQSKMLLVLNR